LIILQLAIPKLRRIFVRTRLFANEACAGNDTSLHILITFYQHAEHQTIGWLATAAVWEEI
jgi:hypothetical protein